MKIDEAAKLMGAAKAEIKAVEEHLHGWLIHHRDGTAYVAVDADSPDAEGKTGLMLAAPNDAKGYIATFPVFAAPVESPAGVAEVLAPAEPAPTEAEKPAAPAKGKP